MMRKTEHSQASIHVPVRDAGLHVARDATLGDTELAVVRSAPGLPPAAASWRLAERAQPGHPASPVRYSVRMRCIGRNPSRITALPNAEALRAAALQQDMARAMAAVHSTGIAKGVHRFATQPDADAQRLDALVRVIAANVVRRRHDP